MSPHSRNILVFEDAKTFIPLQPWFIELGFELVAASDIDKLETLDHVIGYFACFYRCLDRPFAARLRRNRLAKAGIPTITWNRDAPHYLNRRKWRLHLASTLQVLDIYATHSLADADRYHFAPRTLYLANALEPSVYSTPQPVSETFSRLRDESNYAVDVSFFGGMDGTRYKEDKARAVFFAALSARLQQENISHIFRETNGMTPAQQIEFIHSSKINLNYGARCEYNAPQATGLPERCFGIPGCGGFLLCDKRTHARDDFRVGENWAEFDASEGVEDCLVQIKFWLAHFQSARDLAERCHDQVNSFHTYQQRAETLIKTLQAWHAGEQRGEQHHNNSLISGKFHA